MEHRWLSFRACAPTLAALVLLVGYPQMAKAVPDDTRGPRGVFWGGRAFTDADGLRAWLEQRHRSYDLWALRHPRAAAELDARVPETPSGGRLSLPTNAWVGLSAFLLPALVAFVLAAWPPTLTLARRRIELSAFAFGIIAAALTAVLLTG